MGLFVVFSEPLRNKDLHKHIVVISVGLVLWKLFSVPIMDRIEVKDLFILYYWGLIFYEEKVEVSIEEVLNLIVL